MARVRVATYNILSSALANPSDLTGCNPKDLSASVRLPKIETKVCPAGGASLFNRGGHFISLCTLV